MRKLKEKSKYAHLRQYIKIDDDKKYLLNHSCWISNLIRKDKNYYRVHVNYNNIKYHLPRLIMELFIGRKLKLS